MYLFYLGRDKQIAKLEILSVLDKWDIEYAVVTDAKDYLIIKSQDKLPIKELQERLAGTIRIAKFFHASESITDELVEKADFYFPKSFNYVINPIGLSSDDVLQIEGFIKRVSKKYKARAVEKRTVEQEVPTPAKYYSWRLDEGLELFVIKHEGQFLFAQSVACPDPKEFEFKDTKRPTQKFTRGTSFRLAKMMVNILPLSAGETMVDPFCGIGTFLIEGLSAGYNVIGIDNEKEMTDASKKNIDWAFTTILERTRDRASLQQLIRENAQSAEFEADGCVFEPFMGPFLKDAPNDKKAQKIMTMLETLYVEIFKNVRKSMPKGAPVVCILPHMVTNSGKKVTLSDKFFQKIGFSLVNLQEKYPYVDLQNPLVYSTPDGSRIGRKLYILISQ